MGTSALSSESTREADGQDEMLPDEVDVAESRAKYEERRRGPAEAPKVSGVSTAPEGEGMVLDEWVGGARARREGSRVKTVGAPVGRGGEGEEER